MPNLTQEQITSLIGKLKKFPYLCQVDETTLGPLAEPPAIAPEIETQDVTLYETLEDVQASFLSKNDVRITLKCRDVDAALELLNGIKKGDNIMSEQYKHVLVLVPITDAEEKSITFSNAYLQPGLNVTPASGETPTDVELVFLCKADAATGKPFVYA